MYAIVEIAFVLAACLLGVLIKWVSGPERIGAVVVLPPR